MVAKTQGHEDERARWDDIRIFLAAFRAGSLGGAATQLGVDISTISRRLAAFEQALGKPLFERTREGLSPTRAATVMLPAAELMEGGHARLLRDVNSLQDSPEGVVRLSAAPGLVDTFVTPALTRFHTQHPRITLELDASTRVLDLTRHEADLALRSTRPQGAGLVITQLLTARWVAAGSERLVASLGRLAAWTDAPWLVWDKDLTSFAPSRWLQRHVPDARVLLRTSHFAAQLGAAEAGLGILMLPDLYLRPRNLVPVRLSRRLAPSAAAWPSDKLWLVGPRAQREVARVAAVWTFFANELRQARV